MQEIFALLILLPMLGNSVHVNNEFCSPRPTLVPIDNPNYKFFPYFVKLHRCGGSCNTIQPSVQSCVPLQFIEVPVTVQVVGSNKMKNITEWNHTRCGCECVINPSDCNLELEEWRPDSCQCKCKYGDQPPVPCGNGFTWSKNDCRCMCKKEPLTCPPNKVWSSKVCGCVCKDRRFRKCAKKQKFVDEEKCMCTKVMAPKANRVSSPQPQQKGGFRKEFYIVLFLGQFAFMYLVFDAILYRKKAGLIYRLTRRCSANKDDRSNIESSRTDIFSESNSAVVTDLPTDAGERNAASSDV